jgi:hypothetical protein
MRLAKEINSTIVRVAQDSVGDSLMPRQNSLNQTVTASAFVHFCIY